MQKKIKEFIPKHIIPKTPRNIFSWLLCPLTLLMLKDYTKNRVKAQECSDRKFPLILRFNTGDTEILSIDQDPKTGFIYIAGTTTAVELRVSGA